MLFRGFFIVLSILGWALLSINWNPAFGEELALAFTFAIFFTAILTAANNLVLSYFVDRRNHIKLNYALIFLRRKEAIKLLIKTYRNFSQLPQLYLKIDGVILIRLFQRINTELLVEKENILTSYKKTIKFIWRFTQNSLPKNVPLKEQKHLNFEK